MDSESLLHMLLKFSRRWALLKATWGISVLPEAVPGYIKLPGLCHWFILRLHIKGKILFATFASTLDAQGHQFRGLGLKQFKLLQQVRGLWDCKTWRGNSAMRVGEIRKPRNYFWGHVTHSFTRDCCSWNCPSSAGSIQANWNISWGESGLIEGYPPWPLLKNNAKIRGNTLP